MLYCFASIGSLRRASKASRKTNSSIQQQRKYSEESDGQSSIRLPTNSNDKIEPIESDAGEEQKTPLIVSLGLILDFLLKMFCVPKETCINGLWNFLKPNNLIRQFGFIIINFF